MRRLARRRGVLVNRVASIGGVLVKRLTGRVVLVKRPANRKGIAY